MWPDFHPFTNKVSHHHSLSASSNNPEEGKRMCCRENLTNHEHKTYELLIIVISYNKLTIVNFIAEQSQINNLPHQQVANPSQQQFYELHQNQKWMKVHHSVDTWSSSCSLLFPKSIKSSQNFKTIKRERERTTWTLGK